MAYDIGARIGIDGEKAFRDSIKAINANIKAMGSELKAVTAQFTKNADSEEALTAKNAVLAKSITETKNKIGLLDKQLERQAEKLRDLGRALDEAAKSYGADSKEALAAQNAYNKQAAAVAKLQDQLNGAKAELAGMENAVRDNKDAIDGLGREVENTGEAMEDAGKSAVSFGDLLKANIVSDLVVDGLRRITDGLKDFARFSLESGMNFEAQMSRVQAISGATAEDAGLLADKAKEMGETTVFSATESAQALEYMAMAGWKTDDMLDGLAGIMNLAAASGEELAATSDIVTDALTAFGLTAADSSHFADVLAVASSNANTNVGMMGETFKYVAPVAGAMGYNVEDVAVAIGLMANSSIKASSAGTALRTLLTNMAKPTGDMKNAMYYLGVSLTDDEGKMYSFMDVMDQLRKGFKGGTITAEEHAAAMQNWKDMLARGAVDIPTYEKAVTALNIALNGTTKEQQAEIASMLAGKEAMSGLLAIVNASEEDYQKLSKAISDADGTAQEMANTMTDNLSGSLTLMKSAAEGVGISLYKKIQEPLTNLVNNITENYLPDIKEFVESWDAEDIENFTETLKLLVPVITGATAAMVAYKGASAISGIIDKLKIATEGQTAAQAALNLVMNANPFVLVATAVAGLVAGFITLYKTNETFRNKVNAAWDSVTTTISNSVARIRKFFGEDIPNAAKKALDWFKSIPDQLKQVGRDLIKNLWDGINDKVEWLKSKVRGIGDSIKNIFTGGSSKSSSPSAASPRSAVPAAEEAGSVFSLRAAPAAAAVQSLQRSVSETETNTRAGAALRQVRRDISSTAGSVAAYYSAPENRSGVRQTGNAGNGITPEALAAAVAAAVKREMSGLAVELDGRPVGRLVSREETNRGRALGTL